MSAKHTPGPWTYIEGSEHFTFGSQPPKALQYRYEIDTPLGEVYTSNDSDLDALNRDIAEANARLIAAAPDLLAALFDALTWMDFVDDGQNPSVTERIRRARAAIVKAGAPVPIFKIRGGAR